METLSQSGRRGTATDVQVRAAYGVCRHIARSSARNFYYGFLVLPRRKRDAISSVYAFMRHADDISDDPHLAPREKKLRLRSWLDALHRVSAGGATDDPVLMAVADAQRRYGIPLELLDQLVEGTAMDIAEPSPGDSPALDSDGPRVLYPTFDDLYRYCYHVASVVGLVTIRIFGYRDPSAEPLAERTGIAFQLTNIIRDVKEDASMGRIYLPQEDLDRFGVSAAMLANPSPAQDGSSHPGHGSQPLLTPLLAMEAERAREYYRSAEELLPLIDEDSRPALWSLVEIYRRLLDKIAVGNFDVFGERVRLTTAEKVAVLARGLWLRLTV
jgi:phytoene synthase